MKIPLIAALLCYTLSEGTPASPQIERLKESYKTQGDALFVPLDWLPETRQTVLKDIPDHECPSRLFAELAEIKQAEAKPEQKFEAIVEDYAAKAAIVERLGKLVLHKVKLDAMPLGDAIFELQQLGVKGTQSKGVINVTISGFVNVPRQPAHGDDPFEPGEPEPPKPPKMVSLNAESITFAQAVDSLCKQAGYQWSIQFHIPGIPTLAISPNPNGK